MTDPSLINTEQSYCWNTEVTQQDSKYYPIPQVSNFPDYTQPPNYNTSYSYNVPHSNVSNIPPSNVSNIPLNMSNIPPPTVSNIHPPNISNISPNINPTNSMYFASTTYHNEATNFSSNISYQNQMDPQCNDQYYSRTDSVHKQYMNENYTNWNVKSDNAYNDNTGNEWHSNNSSASWTYQNTPTSWYDANVTTYNKERLCPTQMYETPQRIEGLKWKYDNREVPKQTVSRQRSRSPQSKQEKLYRSQYEDHRDRYRHNREMSNSRDSIYDKHFERSPSKKHGSYVSRSEGSHVNNKSSRKRSKSREPHSTRDTTPTNNSKRTKGPTEREILLEKYR